MLSEEAKARLVQELLAWRDGRKSLLAMRPEEATADLDTVYQRAAERWGSVWTTSMERPICSTKQN